MFLMELVDINGDGVVVECTSTVDTLAEVEILVKASINQHLGIHCTELEYVDDLIYNVWVNGRNIGKVVIRSVNAHPKGAKNERNTTE